MDGATVKGVKVGAALMQQWNLPPNLQNSVRYHTEPALAAEDNLEISLVHIARLMASAIDSGQAVDQVQLRVEAQVWESTELNAEHIMAVHERADQDTMSVVNSLFSNLVKVDG